MAMPSPVTVPRYTVDDLYSFPDDGNRYELLDGILLVTPAPAPLHEVVVSRLHGALSAYLRPDGTAEVFSHGSVEIRPLLHLEPDLLVVPREAVARGLQSGAHWESITSWWLAVEVSGTSRIYDRDHKGPAYLAVGVREFWRVDLEDRCLYVSRPGGPAEEPHPKAVTWLAREGRTEPLVIPVPDLFP